MYSKMQCFLLEFFICLVILQCTHASNLQGMTQSLKSDKITKIGENWALIFNNERGGSKHNRVKRALSLSQKEKQLILDLHNNYRRLEGASNMEFMVSVKMTYLTSNILQIPH